MIEAHGRSKPRSVGAERLETMRDIAKVETGFSNRKMGLVVTAVLGVVAYFSSFWGQAQVAWEEEGPPREPDQPTTVAAPHEGRIQRQDAPDESPLAPRMAEDPAPAAPKTDAVAQGAGGPGSASGLLALAESAMPSSGTIGNAPSGSFLRQPVPGFDGTEPVMGAGDAAASSGGAAAVSDGGKPPADTGQSWPSTPQQPAAPDTPRQADTPPAVNPPVAKAEASAAVLWGTSGDDILTGSFRDDAIKSLAGSDIIDGQSGDDVIGGGAGDDMIVGGAGHDILFGGAGCDRLNGGDGDDILDGGAGDDILSDGAGYDLVSGGAGNDSILVAADQSQDLFDGGEGRDTLVLTQARHVSVLDIAAGTVTLDNGSLDHFSRIEVFALGGAQDNIVLPSAMTGQGPLPDLIEIRNFAKNDLFVLSEEETLGFAEIFAPDPTGAATTGAGDAQPFYTITRYLPGDTVAIPCGLRSALDGADAPNAPDPHPVLSELEARIARGTGEGPHAMHSHLRHDRPFAENEDQRAVGFDLDQNGTMDIVFTVSTNAPHENLTDAVV